MTARICLFIISLLVLSCSRPKQESDTDFSLEKWLTHYELSGYVETPTYSETIEYSKRLAEASPWVSYQSFGHSGLGKDLPLLIVDKNGNTNPVAIRQSGKAIFFVQACIHAGESDGKDAGLMLIRDMVITRQKENLLDNASFVFIPIFNVDGHDRFGPNNRPNQNGPVEMGWRTNASNLNLNRDYLKADSPEMRAWLELYLHFLPDLFADCHTTDGADYQYPMTYSIETYGNIDTALARWQSETLEPYLIREMANDSMPIFPYVSFREWYNPRSGLVKSAASPMYSQGYAARQNRPGILLESHSLKDYRTRVDAHYKMLEHMLELLNQRGDELAILNLAADARTSSSDFRNDPLAVSFQTSFSDSTMVDFLGFEMQQRVSDYSGSTWYEYFPDKPQTFAMPMFDKVEVKHSVFLPEAYLLPPQWTQAVELLQTHGLACSGLAQAIEIEVESYYFSDVSWSARPFEGRFQLSFKQESQKERVLFPQGTWVIDMNQRGARVAASLLEPLATGSLLEWGFFNPIFEQKEYAEFYVLEKLIPEMLKNDPALNADFESMMTDSAFRSSPRTINNWFLSKSKYCDVMKDKYPVGRLMSRDVLNGLKYLQ